MKKKFGLCSFRLLLKIVFLLLEGGVWRGVWMLFFGGNTLFQENLGEVEGWEVWLFEGDGGFVNLILIFFKDCIYYDWTFPFF